MVECTSVLLEALQGRERVDKADEFLGTSASLSCWTNRSGIATFLAGPDLSDSLFTHIRIRCWFSINDRRVHEQPGHDIWESEIIFWMSSCNFCSSFCWACLNWISFSMQLLNVPLPAAEGTHFRLCLRPYPQVVEGFLSDFPLPEEFQETRALPHQPGSTIPDRSELIYGVNPSRCFWIVRSGSAPHVSQKESPLPVF